MDGREAELERLFELATDLLATADGQGYLTCCNAAWQAALGWPPEKLMSHPFLELVHADDVDAARAAIDRALQLTGTMALELRIRTADGAWRRLLWDARWDGERWYVVAQDLDRAPVEGERDAMRDALTGLPSRALVVDRLAAAVARRERSSAGAVVLLADVDDFSAINDRHGRATGDVVLRAIADRLTDRLRAADTVGRLADDRFVVVAEGLTGMISGAEAVIERVQGAFARPIPTRGGPLNVSASVGVALLRDPQATPEELLRDAEVALRRAQAQGSGETEVFDAALAADVRHRLALAADLRGALQRGELRVAYLPLVSPTDGGAVACEALLRWVHPSRGELAAAEFVRIAEDDGLIVPLGAWILEQACRQVAAWRADGVDIWLSVNLSERQLAQRDLCAVVERTLRESGLPAWALCLEVAESVYLRRPNEVGAALDVLRRLGVRVALDAFGGGASSPADLGRLPVDVVKIDRSLIARLRGNSEDRAVVEAMLEQARRRAVTVVACGVETTAEEQVLRDLGCPVAQGFLYGRPAEAAAFAPGSRDTAQGSIASSHP